MITLQTMLLAMSSTKFDRDLLVHFVAHYISIGVEPHNMYFVMHSEGGVKEDIAAAMHMIREHPINYYILTEPFSYHLKFNVLVCLTKMFIVISRYCCLFRGSHTSSLFKGSDDSRIVAAKGLGRACRHG